MSRWWRGNTKWRRLKLPSVARNASITPKDFPRLGFSRLRWFNGSYISRNAGTARASGRQALGYCRTERAGFASPALYHFARKPDVTQVARRKPREAFRLKPSRVPRKNVPLAFGGRLRGLRGSARPRPSPGRARAGAVSTPARAITVRAPLAASGESRPRAVRRYSPPPPAHWASPANHEREQGRDALHRFPGGISLTRQGALVGRLFRSHAHCLVGDQFLFLRLALLGFLTQRFRPLTRVPPAVVNCRY